MEQVGLISHTQNKMADVIVRRTSSCGDKCSSCGSECHVSGIHVKIKNTVNAQEGDLVEIGMKTKTVLKSAFFVYMIPLLMMILGIAVGITLFKQMGYNNYESLGFLMGILFLGFSFIILKVIDNKVKKKNTMSFEMVRIITH